MYSVEPDSNNLCRHVILDGQEGSLNKPRGPIKSSPLYGAGKLGDAGMLDVSTCFLVALIESCMESQKGSQPLPRQLRASLSAVGLVPPTMSELNRHRRSRSWNLIRGTTECHANNTPFRSRPLIANHPSSPCELPRCTSN